ncbi:hypothetical protein PVAND_008336 [Polypedilum vanderplanki]|uniref:Uncharacterized protein n=1 Tax=Polypedilum vanderplanki TaxID=319348 RepID=A0A9J6CAQ0_POLVA|nr:hypothetical protein PVAND_008336 [Polypedilum vanderplanki]
MSFYWWFLFVILPIFIVLICISVKKRNQRAVNQRLYASTVPVTVYTVQGPPQPQVFIAPVPNNFPHSQHISPSTQQVEQRLNIHYAQQQAQQAPPPYINHQSRY